MVVRRSLCAEEEAFYELMKWTDPDVIRPEILCPKYLWKTECYSNTTEEIDIDKDLETGSWNFRLQIKPYAGPISPDGLVDIIKGKTDAIIVKGIEVRIAKEICRLWNDARNENP